VLEGLAKAGGKALGDARFTLVNLLPAAVLVLFVLALYRTHLYSDPHPKLARLVPSKDQLSAGGAVVLFFAVFVIAVLLQPFQVALVRLLEGYWGDARLGHLAAAVPVELHRRRRSLAKVLQDEPERLLPPDEPSLAAAARYSRRLARANAQAARARARLRAYPENESRLLPTALGNTLRAGEDAAGSRYGLDAMTVYPRLYPSLSPTLDRAMSRQLDLIDTTSALCVTFLAATVLAIPLLARHDRWSALVALPALLAALAYRGAQAAGQGHGALLATAFDLHRFDMLVALHYPLPRTAAYEYEFNRALSRLLAGRTPARRIELVRETEYEHAATTAPAVKTPGVASAVTAPADDDGPE
jgi:hypothetical protein